MSLRYEPASEPLHTSVKQLFLICPAFERRWNIIKGFKDFYLQAKTRIWPWLPYMCRVCSTSAGTSVFHSGLWQRKLHHKFSDCAVIVVQTFIRTPRPESGHDCLICAECTRQWTAPICHHWPFWLSTFGKHSLTVINSICSQVSSLSLKGSDFARFERRWKTLIWNAVKGAHTPSFEILGRSLWGFPR